MWYVIDHFACITYSIQGQGDTTMVAVAICAEQVAERAL